MTRFRKTLLASALVAASLSAPAPAHASILGFFQEAFSGLYYHPLPKPIRLR